MAERSSVLPAGAAKIALTSLALLALLALTVAISFLDLGWINIAANLGIAALKAALVAWVFMELSEVRGPVRLFALGVLAWIALMFAFTAADYLFRSGV
ncbi:MAG: cytochrome C oxidase subunit IV family protein [Oceanicaulis sp.]